MTPALPHVQPWRRALPTVAAVAVVLATALLGRWQLQRADEKALLQAALEARAHAPSLDLAALAATLRAASEADALRFRPAHAHGHYLPQGQILIDNREHDGVPGYHVLTPLDLGGGRAVLVNRGFVARDAGYPRAPAVAVPGDAVEVAGTLALAHSRYLELSADTINGQVWQNLRIDQYTARTGISVLPLVLLADPPGAGLLAVHETPDANIAMHRGYAFQWFSLCATTVLLYSYFTFFRRKSPQP
ncbi:MAG: SURF1 family protein [Pseudomonadota bacterium]|nr:SURF1 family protein [Pseudomonadota bacterium]